MDGTVWVVRVDDYDGELRAIKGSKQDAEDYVLRAGIGRFTINEFPVGWEIL